MADVDAVLADLTEVQREAATHVEGPLLVVAGAGSGKTRVITRRVAYLCTQGIAPYRILAVTFTNKASGEMRERIEQLAGTGGAWVSTFHSLCAKMLRISADAVGLDPHFSIYDRDDQLKAVKMALEQTDVGGTMTPAAALHRISGAKAKLWDPRELARHAESFRDEVVVKIYEAYHKLLGSNGALDFDDLLMRVAIGLRDEAGFRDRWQPRFHFVLIDEYQDTNHAQYLIARFLAELRRNICATGDADQSIYGWRGADIENILGFTKDYPDARVVKLEQNFRSTKTICRGAASVIERNAMRHERSIWTENEEGTPIRFRLGTDADGEAAVALAEIRRAREAGGQWGDVAIFYRTNAQSRSFEEAFVQASVPYRIVGAVAFYNRQEIKDLVAYLRVCVNARDDLGLVRIINRPTRGIGQASIARMRAWAAEHEASLWQAVARVEEIDALGGRARNAIVAFRDLIEGFRSAMDGPVAELCERVVEESGCGKWLRQPDNEERRENVQEFLAKAALYDEVSEEGGLTGFLEEVALVSDVDGYDGAADAVSLMTIHAAKGLEFPMVIITGLEEGLLPHANSMTRDREVEEERRLFYVAMTRAQRELVLTAAGERAQYSGRGGWGDDDASWSRTPSRFLAEVDRGALGQEGAAELAEFQDSGADQFGETVYRPRRQARGSGRPRWAPPAETTPEAAAEAGAAAAARCEFAVGDWVMHPKHGVGRIVTLQVSEQMTLATIALIEGGKRIFALEHCDLEKL